jgi:hypothetical protein
VECGSLGVELNPSRWNLAGLRAGRAPVGQVASGQPQTLPEGNATVVLGPCRRSQETTLFRRAKDNLKDKAQTKERAGKIDQEVSRHRFWSETRHAQQRFWAGSAHPIPGKYDSVSED